MKIKYCNLGLFIKFSNMKKNLFKPIPAKHINKSIILCKKPNNSIIKYTK